MNWLKKRFKEPSTWAGLPMIIYGLGEVGKVKEAPALAETVGTAGQYIVSGDTFGGLAALVMGAAAAVLGEGGRK